MKLPSSVGLKKTKAIETMVAELGLEPQPIPTGEHRNWNLDSDAMVEKMDPYHYS